MAAFSADRATCLCRCRRAPRAQRVMLTSPSMVERLAVSALVFIARLMVKTVGMECLIICSFVD